MNQSGANIGLNELDIYEKESSESSEIDFDLFCVYIEFAYYWGEFVVSAAI